MIVSFDFRHYENAFVWGFRVISTRAVCSQTALCFLLRLPRHFVAARGIEPRVLNIYLTINHTHAFRRLCPAITRPGAFRLSNATRPLRPGTPT